jgi:hypothetical protein
MGMAAAGGEIHTPAADEVKHCRLLRQTHGMMDGQSIDRNAETQPAGPLGHRAQDHVRRGEQRKLRLAVDLGDPKSVESQPVGKLGLGHELFQARRRR